MVELYEPIGWDFIELKQYLETILEKPVDLVTNKALKPMIREDILKEVVHP
jgi:predicted nucleotidyltransferase